VGCPIRRSLDRRLPAPPQSISPRGRVLRRPQAPRHPPCAHLRESVFVSSRLAPAAVRRARAPPRRHGRSAGPCLGQLPRRSPLPGSRDPVGMTRSALHLSMYLDAPRAGGAAGTRTPDLRRAKAALSQLSYGPVGKSENTTASPRRSPRPPSPVGAPGLEPGASALSGPRSDRLSYAPRRLQLRADGTGAAPKTE
jgi:hypothetical protein